MTKPARRRVIINTAAKNVADDQFAIVHSLLSPMFDVRGLIPAHFGTRRSRRSIEKIGLPDLGILLDSATRCTGWRRRPTRLSWRSTTADCSPSTSTTTCAAGTTTWSSARVHLVETFEFFHPLRRNNWQGVWHAARGSMRR